MSQVSPLSQWSVPSTRTPGEFYTVHLYPNGATSCTCAWGQKEEAPSKCWHVNFARVIENEAVQNEVGDLTIARAMRGDIACQLIMLQTCGSLLANEGRFFAAHRCFELISKYMLALSIQGAVPIEEAAQQAVSSHQQQPAP